MLTKYQNKEIKTKKSEHERQDRKTEPISKETLIHNATAKLSHPPTNQRIKRKQRRIYFATLTLIHQVKSPLIDTTTKKSHPPQIKQ